MRRATSPEEGSASTVFRKTGYSRAQLATTFWIFVRVWGNPETRACVWSMTGGTSRAPMPTTAARVATTAAVSPIQRARRKRRSSTSVMAERYTAHSTAMKTRSSTSTTRMTNQMARAATKSATNVAPDNREEADGSVFSGCARRGVVILDQLRLRRSLAQLLRLVGGRGREEPHLALELDQLLIGVRSHFQALELLHERIAREILVHLGRRDQLALLVLDLLGHALERLEHALVAHRRHRLLDALVRLGALLPGDQDVLLALRVLDPVVQLAERQFELLGLLAVFHPRLVQLHGALRVLVVAQQGLLRQVVPPLLHRQHGPALPVLGALLFRVHLRREPLLIRDGRRHLLLRLCQLTPHVADQLVQHLFRILGAIDPVEHHQIGRAHV